MIDSSRLGLDSSRLDFLEVDLQHICLNQHCEELVNL